MNRFVHFLAALCLVSFTSLAATTQATEIDSVKIGLAGLYHVGAWTPLSVVVRNQANGEGRSDNLQLEVEAPDPDDNVVLYRSEQAQVPAERLSLLFKTGRMQYDLVVRLKDDRGTTLSEKKYRVAQTGGELPAPLPCSTKIWIGIGKPAGFEQPVTEVIGDNPVARGAIDDLDDLPRNRRGFESVDALVIAANGPSSNSKSVAESLADFPNQAASLQNWVGSGGLVLISVGRGLDNFKGSPLAKWVPVLPGSQDSLRSFAPLQEFGGKPTRFDGTVPISTIEADPRRIIVRGTSTPLVVEGPYNFGRVYFCALDLDQEPFLEWEGLTRFYDRIINRGINRPDQISATSDNSRLSHGGVSDLATQLTRGVSRFDGIQRTSLSGNLVLLIAYLLIIGPIDYLIVCRLLKRPEWTWGTLPLLIALAGGAGLVYARSTNGNESRANSLSVVDFDSATNRVRTKTWISLYSAATRRVSVDVQPQWPGVANSSEARLGWWGFPEATIGGLYRSAGLQFGRREYSVGGNGIDRVPLQIWSTKSFESEWMGEGTPILKTNLASTGVGSLQGTVVWTLAEPLLDCMLVYGNRVYFPRTKQGKLDSSDLPAHFVWDPAVSSQTSQRELRGFLTKLQTRTIFRKGGSLDSEMSKNLETIAAVYDSSSRNYGDFLPILSFHEYAGGSNYTQVQNSVLEQMDWSHHLRMGSAVLFGRVGRPPVEISIDGVSSSGTGGQQATTYVRCLLPVAKIEGRDPRDFKSPVKKEGEE